MKRLGQLQIPFLQGVMRYVYHCQDCKQSGYDMRKFFLLFFLTACCAFSTPAYAEPRCGKVEEDVVEDLFRAIDRIDHYYDLEDEMEKICAIIEAHKDWERDQSKKKVNREYRDKRDSIIEDIESEMRSLTGYLTELRGWIYYDAVGGVAEAKRIAHIRRTKKDINFYMISLDGIVSYLNKLKE